jgi:hypothetical protein
MYFETKPSRQQSSRSVCCREETSVPLDFDSVMLQLLGLWKHESKAANILGLGTRWIVPHPGERMSLKIYLNVMTFREILLLQRLKPGFYLATLIHSYNYMQHNAPSGDHSHSAGQWIPCI